MLILSFHTISSLLLYIVVFNNQLIIIICQNYLELRLAKSIQASIIRFHATALLRGFCGKKSVSCAIDFSTVARSVTTVTNEVVVR